MLVTLQEMKDYLGIGGITYDPVTVDLEINTTAGTIVRSSGNWNTDQVKAGSLLTLSGFTNVTNNVEVAVTEVTNSTTIKYLGPVGMVDETGLGTSFDQEDVPDDTTYDQFLTGQLTLISDTVEEYCNRKFLAADYTQTFYRDEEGLTQRVPLNNFPVNSIASVFEDTTEILDYRLNARTGFLYRKDGFFLSADKLDVTYNAGYADAPSPVKSVVYSLVEERYNKKKSGVNINFGSDVQRVSIPGTISIDFDYSLQSNERTSTLGTILGSYVNVLDAYRSDRAVVGSDRLVYES